MCGIVGLLVKNPALRAQLGELMLPMLMGMSERGPESTGLAVFGVAQADRRRVSLYAGVRSFDWQTVAVAAKQAFGEDAMLSVIGNHAALETTIDSATVIVWVREHFPSLHVMSSGRYIDVYKDTGTPAQVAGRYQFEKLQGSHLVGHTRMATESAVTPAHAHPFTAGEDFCLVHNGSLSNPNSVRRHLERLGIAFDTDNDTEAACRYLAWRMQEGDNLEAAIRKGFDEFDGFYTFLIGTHNSLALVRDAFACKPAVVAETGDYVAIASEFRSLAKLPGIKNANLFEPKPEEIYVWTVQ
ncbi:MAG: amidophosphoribosyltransferase [Betaproteobacteria bacterium]|nr:amidophosphoribosyltransferase [Betaproteobacteria bacterium]